MNFWGDKNKSITTKIFDYFFLITMNFWVYKNKIMNFWLLYLQQTTKHKPSELILVTRCNICKKKLRYRIWIGLTLKYRVHTIEHNILQNRWTEQMGTIMEVTINICNFGIPSYNQLKNQDIRYRLLWLLITEYILQNITYHITDEHNIWERPWR